MNDTGLYPKVHFPEGFDERARDEMSVKGWICATVEVASGKRYALLFCDPDRLNQEINHDFQHGKKYYAEAGLVIVTEVTVESVIAAAQELADSGFFNNLRSEGAV